MSCFFGIRHIVGPFSVERLATEVAVVSPHYVQEGSESNTDYIGGFVATAAILIFSNATRRRRSLPTHIHPMGNRYLAGGRTSIPY